MTLFLVHVVVVAVIVLIAIAMLQGRISTRIGVVAVLLVMAAMFWTASAANGTTAGVGESWLAIGFSVGCFAHSD